MVPRTIPSGKTNSRIYAGRLGLFASQTQRLNCRFVYRRRHLEIMLPLVLANRVPGLLAKLAIDIAGVVALILERFLHIYDHLVGWKIRIRVNRAIATVANES